MKLFKKKERKMYYPRNQVMRIHKSYILVIISLITWSFTGCFAITEYTKLKQATTISTPIVYAYHKKVNPELKPKKEIKTYEVKEETIREREQRIREIARENNFKWEDYLIRLAYCENDTLEPTRRGDIDKRDRGIFQINSYWHAEVPDECAFNLRCSTEWTMTRINNGYQHEWHCDKKI